MQLGVVRLSAALAPDSVSLVDVLAPTDFVLNSALGSSDGQVYRNLQREFFAGRGVFSRASFWKDVADGVASKL